MELDDLDPEESPTPRTAALVIEVPMSQLRRSVAIMRVVPALVVAASITSSAFAECITIPLKRAFKGSRAFFVGTVIDAGDAHTPARMRVEEAFKGVKLNSIVVVAADSGIDGHILSPGVKYLIHAQCDRSCPNLHPNAICVGRCGYTYPVDDPWSVKAIPRLRRWAWWWRLPLSGRGGCAG